MVRSISIVIFTFIVCTALGNVIPNSKINDVNEETNIQNTQSLENGDSDLIREKRFANKYGYYSDSYYPSNSYSNYYPSNYYRSNRYYSSSEYPSTYYSTSTVADNPIARYDGPDKTNLYYQPLFKYRETRTKRKKKLFVPNLWG